jgi:hypothetical protein
MNARPSRLLPLPMTLCALLVAASCQIEDPPPAQTMLRIKLNDSLARYEKVVVEVYARPDSTTPLDTLWKDKLLFPSNQIPAYEVKTQGVSGYLVKVTGFKGGNQLALLTRIYYSFGREPFSRLLSRYAAIPGQVAAGSR